MNKILRTFALGTFLAATLTQVISPSVQADTGEIDVLAENRGLDAKQAALTKRLNHIDQIKDSHGRYVLLRDTYLFGDRGIKKLSSEWHTQFLAWTDSWKVIVNLAANPRELAQFEVQETLKVKLNAQYDAWKKLKKSALRMHERVSEALLQIVHLRPIPDDYVEGYKDRIKILNDKFKLLSDLLIQAEKQFNQQSVDHFEEFVGPTTDVIVSKLKKESLNYPELSRAVALVNDALRASQELEPHAQDVAERFNDFRDHLLASRVFHAEDSLKELHAQAQVSTAAIRATRIDPQVIEPYLESIRQHVKTAENLYHGEVDPGSMRSYVRLGRSNFHTQTQILTFKCKSPDLAKHLNCELLRPLLKLQLDQFKGFSKEDLKAIEFTLERVKQGPLSVKGALQ